MPMLAPELVTALSTLPTEDTYDYLADMIEDIGRSPGGMHDEPVHRAPAWSKC